MTECEAVGRLLFGFFFVNKLVLFQTCPLAAISKKIYHTVPISVRRMKTAATSWQAANAALTLASLSASVKKDTMGKDYNMNAQVSLMSQYLGFPVCPEYMASLVESKKVYFGLWLWTWIRMYLRLLENCLLLKTKNSSSSQTHLVPCLQQQPKDMHRKEVRIGQMFWHSKTSLKHSSPTICD